jgi:transposase
VKEEANTMTFVGCDLHARQQHVAVLDTETGEVQARRLAHDDQTVEHFYASLPRPVTVGVESTGYAQWFHALIQRQGHTLLVGDAARIRAMVVRKTKTDRRDASHLLQLLSQDRFPVIWVPDPCVRDLRALVSHRMRLVRIRTMVKNGLHAIALNQRLAAGSALFTRRGRAQLQALALPPHTTQRRDESLALLTWLDAHIDPLNAQIAEAANADDQARRLMTHPGVGPLTALATVLILGPVTRFPTSKHVVSYIGLAPTVDASADKCRLGHVSKQGNALLRYVLGQAGQVAVRSEPDLRRVYTAVMHRHGRAKAKVAVARKLLVRLYILLRDQIDYIEFRDRGRSRHRAHPRAEVPERA